MVWGKNTQLLPLLPRWPFRRALMQIARTDCLWGAWSVKHWGLERLGWNYQKFDKNSIYYFLCLVKWQKWDAKGICISCIFVFVTTRGSGICAARPLQGARGCNWEARAEETEYSHCQLLPPSTSTSTSLHMYLYGYLHSTHPLISLRCHLAHQLVSL